MKPKSEDKLYDIIKEVTARVFDKISPMQKFPEDFLDEETKKALKISIKYPKTLKFGPKVIKRGLRAKKTEINLKEIKKLDELIKELEKESELKYMEVILPEGEVKLNLGRKVEICSAKSGIAFLKLDNLEKAKYLLYSRKKGKLLYKIPKDEKAVKRAVEDYEKYLKQIREKLEKAFIKRKANREAAEYLAGEAMKDCRL